MTRGDRPPPREATNLRSDHSPRPSCAHLLARARHAGTQAGSSRSRHSRPSVPERAVDGAARGDASCGHVWGLSRRPVANSICRVSRLRSLDRAPLDRSSTSSTAILPTSGRRRISGSRATAGYRYSRDGEPNVPMQCWGPETSQWAHQILDGAQVRLVPDPSAADVDKFGRSLRYVPLSDGTDHSVLAASEGMAAVPALHHTVEQKRGHRCRTHQRPIPPGRLVGSAVQRQRVKSNDHRYGP